MEAGAVPETTQQRMVAGSMGYRSQVTWSAKVGSRVGSAASLLVIALASTSCGGSQDASVRAAADDFYEAVATGDGVRACALLAPRTRSELEQSSGDPCAEAIRAERVPQVEAPEDVRAFGTMAQVRYAAETTFLTRFQDGWLVVAASCVPGPADVYDCQITGG
ncbi:hypothetical protein [Nocardioides sp.]|uniref:hypothetical protein n=1 Tax=Nocardioides sp. TaxID=35761 RepID=UPI002ED0F02F